MFWLFFGRKSAGLNEKLKHWRGIQAENACESAPVLEFDVVFRANSD
jgi:hypothetical protein